MNAQFGSADLSHKGTQIGELASKSLFHMYPHLIRKYNMDKDCIRMEGVCHRCFSVLGIMKRIDNTLFHKSTEFEVVIDENGIDVNIPMIDDKKMFSNIEDAPSSMKKLPTYTLDDEDEDEAPINTKIKVTIEVDISKIDKVKELGTIL